MDIELSESDLYRDLVAAAKTQPPPGSFGSGQFAEDTGLTRKQALDVLKARMAEGALEGDMFTVDGHRQWCFWFPQEPKG